MIKERHLVPGKVIARAHSVRKPVWNLLGRHVDNVEHIEWVPCMVIAYLPMGRRHGRSRAVVGWTVVVLWLDGRARCVDECCIDALHEGWKALW